MSRLVLRASGVSDAASEKLNVAILAVFARICRKCFFATRRFRQSTINK